MRFLKISAVLAAAALALSCNSTSPTAGGSSAAPKASTAPSASTAPAAATTTVTVSDFKFDPATVTIKAGDTVTWNFQGPTVHTATSDASSTESWDSGNQGVGQTYSHTFTKAGTFAYHCTPHMTAMKGTVIVQ